MSAPPRFECLCKLTLPERVPHPFELDFPPCPQLPPLSMHDLGASDVASYETEVVIAYHNNHPKKPQAFLHLLVESRRCRFRQYDDQHQLVSDRGYHGFHDLHDDGDFTAYFHYSGDEKDKTVPWRHTMFSRSIMCPNVYSFYCKTNGVSGMAEILSYGAALVPKDTSNKSNFAKVAQAVIAFNESMCDRDNYEIARSLGRTSGQ